MLFHNIYATVGEVRDENDKYLYPTLEINIPDINIPVKLIESLKREMELTDSQANEVLALTCQYTAINYLMSKKVD